MMGLLLRMHDVQACTQVYVLLLPISVAAQRLSLCATLPLPLPLSLMLCVQGVPLQR